MQVGQTIVNHPEGCWIKRVASQFEPESEDTRQSLRSIVQRSMEDVPHEISLFGAIQDLSNIFVREIKLRSLAGAHKTLAHLLVNHAMNPLLVKRSVRKISLLRRRYRGLRDERA